MFGGCPRRAVLVAAAVVTTVALAVAPGRALAADASIDFSSLPTGTAVSTQYAGQDAVFGQSPSGPDQPQPLTVETPSVSPPTPGAKVAKESCFSEVCQVYQWVSFTAPMNHVSIEITASGSNPVTVTAQDGGGNPVDSVSHTVTAGGFTQFSVSAPGNATTIQYIEISTGVFQAQSFSITDLTYGPLPAGPPAPDFGLVPNFGVGGQGISVVAGGPSVTAQVILRRYNGSTGSIGLQTGSLPGDVGASIQPDPTTGGDASTFTVTFIAGAKAPPVVKFPVIVTATPTAGAGSVPHTVTIPVTVTGNFDLRVQGIEVTQGVQSTGTLQPFISGGLYSGVPLAAYKKTIARVYADVHGVPSLSGVAVVLHAFRNGVELPGSPLNPDYGPAPLTDTGDGYPPLVSSAERTSDANAFTFTLPFNWANGTLRLVADIVPPDPGFFGPQTIECGTPACHQNDAFAVNGIQFNPTHSYNLCPVALAINGQQPPPPNQTFLYAQAVTPSADLFYPPFYLGTLDVSGEIGSSYTQNGSNTYDDVEDWDDDNGKYCDGAIGVTPTGTNGLTSGNDSEVDYSPSRAGDNRPLSSVAHELFHQYGLPHASNECGGGGDGDNDDIGQSGESWSPALSAWPSGMSLQQGEAGAPTDGIGQISGIGLDTTSEPYTILADGLNQIGTYLDFMSYCFPPGGNIGNGDPGQWISPRNWIAAFSNQFQTARDLRASAARARTPSLQFVAAIHPSQLRVIGSITKLGTEINSVGPNVGPGPRRAPRSLTSSAVTLLARGARGQTLKSVPMVITGGHMDRVGPFDTITAVIPAAGVDSLAVESNGTIVATRSRPTHPPRVRILAPTGRATVGRRATVLVRWTATNPENLKLKASVDYSPDGGRSWRTIFIGGNRGRASLPSFYFVRSTRARVRVRINDGFNESVAASATFTAVGTPPFVTIAAPARRTRIAGDARLALNGSAVDQMLRTLGGRSLRWYDGPFLIGTGTMPIAPPLPPGGGRIRLVAADASGSASASVSITVTPVSLPYLRLKLPARIRPRAKRLTLTASSAAPATLRVGRSTFHLTRHVQRLTLRITPGRGPLLLELVATIQGRSTPFANVVRR